jgi:hypothetical protein
MISALFNVMIERYWIFRKQKKFLFWNYVEEVDVRIPKDYQPEYNQKLIEFKMECISLIDKGYRCGFVTEELEELWRKQISKYLIDKNVVWE